VAKIAQCNPKRRPGLKTHSIKKQQAGPSTFNKGDQDWKRDNHPKNETCQRIVQYNPKRRPGLKTRSIKRLERERQERMKRARDQPSTSSKGDQDWKGDNHPKTEMCPRIAQYNPKRRPGLTKKLERERQGEKSEKMQAREVQPSTTNKGDQDWKRDNHPENETCPKIAQYNPKRRPGLKKH